MSKTFSAFRMLLNQVSLISDSVDPTAGGGVAAAIGSIYVRSTTAQVWQKTGGADTAWTRLATSSQVPLVVNYVAAGGETDFMVTIGTTQDNDDYGLSWAPAGMSSIPGNLDLPDILAGDRTTTQFRVTTAALTAGDKLTFFVFPQ